MRKRKITLEVTEEGKINYERTFEELSKEFKTKGIEKSLFLERILDSVSEDRKRAIFKKMIPLKDRMRFLVEAVDSESIENIKEDALMKMVREHVFFKESNKNSGNKSKKETNSKLNLDN